jgi:hypothetical protein
MRIKLLEAKYWRFGGIIYPHQKVMNVMIENYISHRVEMKSKKAPGLGVEADSARRVAFVALDVDVAEKATLMATLRYTSLPFYIILPEVFLLRNVEVLEILFDFFNALEILLFMLFEKKMN